MTYFGPMADARSYFLSLGFKAPDHGNPADALMDLVTPCPDSADDVSSVVASAFQKLQAPALAAEAEGKAALGGLSVPEMVQAMQKGAMGDAGTAASLPSRIPRRAAPIQTQVAAVLGRKLRITLRNPVAGALLVLVPCMLGTLVGSAFQGIGAGDTMFLQQVPFFFILVSTSCFQSMGLMPGLVDERMYMKYETSEALYSEAVLALANFCADVPLALLGSCLHIMIAYMFSGYPLSLFGPIFGWTLLVFLVFDSLFACVAAFAPDAQLAQLMATPFLTIFMLFNGFVVSPDSAPTWCAWIFHICPNFYTMQGIIVRLADHEGPAAWQLVDTFGYKAGQETRGVIVMLSIVAILRCLQVVALKFFNNIQR